MPVTCMMSFRIDWDHYIIISYQKGKVLVNVTRHHEINNIGVMQKAYAPVDGRSKLSEWTELRARVFDRHMQRSMGLGDVFSNMEDIRTASTAGDVEELQKSIAGMGVDDFVSSRLAILPQCVAGTSPMLEDCAHDWSDLTVDVLDFRSFQSCRREIEGPVRSTCRNPETFDCQLAPENFIKVLSFLCHRDLPDCGKVDCRKSSRRYQCRGCKIVRCGLCATKAATDTVAQLDVDECVSECDDRLRPTRERILTHQRETSPIFYVTKKVSDMKSRAAWIKFELGHSIEYEISIDDLPTIARTFLRFMADSVNTNQKKTVLDIFGLLTKININGASAIRPFSTQEEFLQVWDPEVLLCHECGKKREHGQACSIVHARLKRPADVDGDLPSDTSLERTLKRSSRMLRIADQLWPTR